MHYYHAAKCKTAGCQGVLRLKYVGPVDDLICDLRVRVKYDAANPPRFLCIVCGNEHIYRAEEIPLSKFLDPPVALFRNRI